MALGKGSKENDVQESELPEVCFYATEVGNGRVFVQIRKKKSKNTFAVWVTGGTKPKVTDEKVSRQKIENASKSRRLILENTTIIDCDVRRLLKILKAK